MWDDRKYELVIPGHPTRARRVSVGRPGITSEYVNRKYTHRNGKQLADTAEYCGRLSARNERKLHDLL